jgi:hypothetical protein
MTPPGFGWVGFLVLVVCVLSLPLSLQTKLTRATCVWTGSFTSIQPCPRHVCFAPNSNLIVDIAFRPFGASRDIEPIVEMKEADN